MIASKATFCYLKDMIKKIFLHFRREKKLLIIAGALLFSLLVLFSRHKGIGREEVEINREEPLSLFEGQSWMKGERELQLLERRALKEDLERAIASFALVTRASVAVDIVPQRMWG